MKSFHNLRATFAQWFRANLGIEQVKKVAENSGIAGMGEFNVLSSKFKGKVSSTF